ncbi:MAG: hypothetical protein ABIJ10_07485, partial [Candidatus Micrarchaeota archaeon]
NKTTNCPLVRRIEQGMHCCTATIASLLYFTANKIIGTVSKCVALTYKTLNQWFKIDQQVGQARE